LSDFRDARVKRQVLCWCALGQWTANRLEDFGIELPPAAGKVETLAHDLTEGIVTVDFRLSPRRDVAAAKAFFRKATKSQERCPRSITLDGYAASHRAACKLKPMARCP
jgi:hypothetical protein